MNVYDVASRIYNELLGIYLDRWEEDSDDKIKKMNPKYDPFNSTLDMQHYTEWFRKEDEESVDILLLPKPTRDGKVKERTGIEIPTPKKLLTRFPGLSAQMKAENNSCN